jgi:transcription-repair coupling factor (superfamily II helicase)
MAMSGIRDMSVINEAPSNRYPVQTYVMEYNEGVIADAIRRELRRGGQVFYLHNHIDSIESCATRVSKMAPDATVAYAHGRMGEEEISDIWRRLINHEIDILVCTTIIESGVDVSNCNTLIVENADNMGLSQLYQLRGRVGRSSRRAYAYLTFTKGKVLSEIAVKRLSAMREFTQFGSGFHIAMRDLEIRGAGSILGGQQHGHMEAVGYDMYVKLLSNAIAEEKGEAPQIPETECLVDIRIPAHIPEKYISNITQRIEIYRKIAAVKTEEDALDVTDEIIDRFGDIPPAVKGLIDVALLRNMAAKLNIHEIKQQNNMIMFLSKTLDMSVVAKLSAVLKGRLVVNAGEKPYVAVKLIKGDDVLFIMRETLKLMCEEDK